MFKELINEIMYNEKRVLSKLDRKIEEIKEKAKINLKEKQEMLETFKDWEGELN